MKRYLAIIGLSALLLSGCQLSEEIDNLTGSQPNILIGTIEERDTRTEMGDLINGIYENLWSRGDEIGVLVDQSNKAVTFTLSDGAGTTRGIFSGNSIGSRYTALYPAGMLAGSSGNTLTLELPELQEYTMDSYDAKCFPMLAVSGNTSLNFMNLCSILKISLTGTQTIRSIEFTPNDPNIQASGRATVNTRYTTSPTLQMQSSGGRSVTLLCNDVRLSASIPTDFHIVLPAQTYHGGFTLTINATQGKMTKSTTTDIVMRRSELRAIPTFAFTQDQDSGLYTSTDYSRDGDVSVLQSATIGNGIDIVFFGDGYSDRQIAAGDYDRAVATAYAALFTEEPFRTFRNLFNVWSITTVSRNEGYQQGGTTAFQGEFGEGTLVKGNDNAVMIAAQQSVLNDSQMDNALLIVMMNSPQYAGTCYMYSPRSGATNDYSSGLSIAYFPVGTTAEGLAQLLHHEACGHGFAKLADEYAYKEMGQIPPLKIAEEKYWEQYGWWKNGDFTNDPTTIKWSHFLADPRYENEVGIFEGAFTYWTGAYRPSENSIMRYNMGGFNAPSREAIYYRMHKLAYGSDWIYNYEEFVTYDEVNRKQARRAVPTYLARPADFVPTAPPVVIEQSWQEALNPHKH